MKSVKIYKQRTLCYRDKLREKGKMQWYKKYIENWNIVNNASVM